MNINQNIKSGKYDSKVSYPSNDIKPHKKDFYTKIKLSSGEKKVLDNIKYETALDKWKVSFNKKILDYRESANNGIKLFKLDLFKEFDLSPEIHEIVYNEAYDRGHSSGLHEIYSHYENLIEFVLKIEKITEDRMKNNMVC